MLRTFEEGSGALSIVSKNPHAEQDGRLTHVGRLYTLDAEA